MFRPRVMVDVDVVDTSTEMLGHKTSLPVSRLTHAKISFSNSPLLYSSQGELARGMLIVDLPMPNWNGWTSPSARRTAPFCRSWRLRFDLHGESTVLHRYSPSIGGVCLTLRSRRMPRHRWTRLYPPKSERTNPCSCSFTWTEIDLKQRHC